MTTIRKIIWALTLVFALLWTACAVATVESGSPTPFTPSPTNVVASVQPVRVINSTITGQGDCLLIVECQEGYTCSGAESVLLRNDIWQGNPEFQGEGDTTCLTWSGIEPAPIVIDHAILNGVRNPPDPCPPDSQCGVSPGVANKSVDAFDGHLVESSPAIDTGTADGAPAHDLEGRPRDGKPNIGAYERWESAAWAYLPLALHDLKQ